MLSLSEVKEFLRIDYDGENVTIQGLLEASKAFLKNSGVNEPDSTHNENIELYKLAQKLLIYHWFENREVVGKADGLGFSLTSIIIQLRYATN